MPTLLLQCPTKPRHWSPSLCPPTEDEALAAHSVTVHFGIDLVILNVFDAPTKTLELLLSHLVAVLLRPEP